MPMDSLSKASLVSIFGGVFFYWLSYYYFDQPIAYFFHQQPHTGLLYTLSQFFTLLGSPKLAMGFTIISFIIAIVILLKQPQSRLANIFLFMGIAMLAAIFFETSLKYLLGRYRPEMLFHEKYGFHLFSREFLMNSTPSGHATRAFVFVAGCSLAWKRFTPLFITLGVLVCLSRLVLEFHFLSDVVFGALLGTLVTLWVARVYYSMTISHPTASLRLR